MQIFGIIFSTHFSQEIVQNQFHFMAIISFSILSIFQVCVAKWFTSEFISFLMFCSHQDKNINKARNTKYFFIFLWSKEYFLRHLFPNFSIIPKLVQDWVSDNQPNYFKLISSHTCVHHFLKFLKFQKLFLGLIKISLTFLPKEVSVWFTH